MKRFIKITASTLILAGCASSSALAFESNAITAKTAVTTQAPGLLSLVENRKAYETLMERQARLAVEARVKAHAEALAKNKTLQANTELVESVVAQLYSRLGKTRYVFSGHTPSGWDCSGLVYWAYQQLGIPVEHSASKQGHSGTKVKEPQIGDIVAFGYVKAKGYYHSAIYVGNNQVIHAGFRPGTTTEIISLDSPAFEGSRITFRRFIEIN
jgi:cell wall-associated NlpC family hydrolase